MKILRFALFLMIISLLTQTEAHPLLFGKQMETKETLPGQDLPVVTVPGKIVFQSNRDGALSEIWLLEEGKLEKLASSGKADQDIPKELPKPFRGMFGVVFADLKYPKWSPDGSKILCLGNNDIKVLSLDGKIEQKIKTPKDPRRPEWSPNGTTIYFIAEDKLPKNKGGSENIYRYDMKDGSARRITNLPPLPGIRAILSLAVSPNGKQIAFTVAGLPKVEGISIWVANSDGSDAGILVKYASDPTWSPDGTKLAYASRHTLEGTQLSEHDELFILDLETNKATRLTNNLWEDRYPVFSPDGTKIAFSSTRHLNIAHGAELFVINIDGTGEARLTPPKRNEEHPANSFYGWVTDQYPDWTR